MNWYDGWFERPRFVVAVLLMVLVGGTVTFFAIPKQADSEIDAALITVTLRQTGVRPDDADRLLVRPVARALRAIEGVKTLRSTAYPGGATVTLEFATPLLFAPPFDALDALARVREQLALAEADLPADAKKPVAQRVNAGLAPLMVLTLSGAVPQAEQLRRARVLRDRIKALPSILDADIIAEREQTVEITIDPLVLSSYGLDAEALLAAVNRANRPGATGGVDTGQGRLDVSLAGLFRNTQDILDLPVKANRDSVVRLRDVATVRSALTDRQMITRFNAQPATVITIRKRRAADVFDTIDAVRGVVHSTTGDWPVNLSVSFSQDRSWRIDTRLTQLNHALVVAVIIVMAIVLATLGWRHALLVGVAIPGSFMLAVLGLAWWQVPINAVVLFAFVMAVGLVVDAAIVMVDNADRLTREGAAPREAWRISVRQLRAPLVCATASTLAVFLPLLFWPGALGETLRVLPLTLLLTTGASLLLALMFIPVLGATISPSATRESAQASPPDPSARAPSRLAREYATLLNASLRHPGWTLGLATVLLVGSAWLYTNYGRNVELLPAVEPSGAIVLVRAPGDLSLSQKRALAIEVERIISDNTDQHSVLMRVGTIARMAGGLPSPADASVIADAVIEFRHWTQRATGEQILAELEARLRQVSGVTIEVRATRDHANEAKPIHIDVMANSAPTLARALAQVRRNAQTIAGIRGVEDSRTAAGVEWQLRIDRARAARFGIDVAKIEQYVRFVTRGVVLGALESPPGDNDTQANNGFGEHAVDIVMRFPARYRSVEGLRAIRVHTERGAVPLEHFATLVPVPRGGLVERVEGKLAHTISAEVDPGVLESDVVRDLRALLQSSSLPVGADVRIRGQDADRDETNEFLLRAFVTSIAIMAAILLIQFNSLYAAFILLLAVVLASVGVRIGLLVLDLPYGIVMSGIGVIALIGIVVNNNVILITTYLRLRADGLDTHDALMRAGQIRLRPVLLTTATTIGAMLPMLIGLDIDLVNRSVSMGAPSAQYWTQMSAAVVFGLAFASLFTLFVTPAALLLRGAIAAARAREQQRAGNESIAGVFAQYGPVAGVAAFTAIAAAWFFIPQITAIRLIDIFSKQIFEQAPSSWFQALESTGFYCLIMLGAAYAYWRGDHVRVDIIRERLSARGKAMIEILGCVLLLAPVCIVVLVPGSEIVLDSIFKEEVSGALFGTPTLWIFKAMILVCFAQLLLIAAWVVYKNVRFLLGREAVIWPPERSLRDAYIDEAQP